jgi:hypothetical protein
MPHRLAEDVEEERRVLHVAITRGRHRVGVLADRTRRSPFLDELAGTAPKTAPRPARTAASNPTPTRGSSGTTVASSKGPSGATGQVGIEAAEGLVLTVPGGYEATVEEDDARGAVVRLASGSTLRVRFGERVELDGRKAPLAAPSELWGAAASAEAQLRAWRTKRSQADGVPAYVVVNDKHLRGIALARPTTPAELVACDGIGPAKLEKYGDEILELLADG